MTIRQVNLIVGVADMQVSSDPATVLITFSLGSCIGIAIYDPEVRVGGLLHYMLPESKLAPEKALKNPFIFADTGIPALFNAAYKLGARKERMRVLVAGGSQIMDLNGFFNIGKRNEAAVREMFDKNKVTIDAMATGGVVSRTIRLAVNNGETWLKVSGREEKLNFPHTQ